MATVAPSPPSARFGSTPHLSPRWLALALAFALGVLALLFILSRQAQPSAEQDVRSAFGALFHFLKAQPFILLFLTMAGGYTLAKARVKGITLGATAGTLLIALGLSLWASARHGINYTVPDFVGTVFFNMFMFAIGMKVGPQFLSGLHRGAKNFILLSVLVPLLATALVLALHFLLKPPVGMTVGIFAGANTATPGLGAATAAFASGAVHLPPGVNLDQARGNMSTAFAFSYCISVVLFVVTLKALPRFFHRDAHVEARTFEREVSGKSAPLPGVPVSFLPGSLPVEQRTFRLEQPNAVGKTLGELREAHPFLDIERIQRGGEAIVLADHVRLEQGDLVTVFGRVPLLLEAAPRLGPEVASTVPELGLETVEVVQKNPAVIGRKLIDLAKDVGHGVYLNAMFRAGEEVPRGNEIVVQKGDVMRVTGTPARIATLEKHVGPVVRPSLTTDILTLALGLAVGGALGALTVPIGKIQFTLGSVALLLVGVAFSTLRTRNPALGGPFPEPARELLEDMGLNVFVAVLGLNSGAGVIHAIQSGALSPIVIGTVVVGLLPALAAWAFGLLRLKMNAAELMGAVAGARCASPGLRAAQEATRSSVPAIAYPITFAISNVLLTLISYLLALMK